MQLSLELLLTVALSFLMAIIFRKIFPQPDAQSYAHKSEGEAEVISESFEGLREIADAFRNECTLHDPVEADKEFTEVSAENPETSGPDYSASEKAENAVEEDASPEANASISRHEEERATHGMIEDDDWEGIEKSDAEKLFAEANKFFESVRGNALLSELDDDQQMQLLGLHKIATEGPCNESQPMAFKPSARAKWYPLTHLFYRIPD